MANVRVFGYTGIAQVQQGELRFHNADSVFVRQEPPLWRQLLTLNGATPVSTAVVQNDQVNIVVIEVDDGTSIRYELQPNGPIPSAVAASTNSPKLSGENVFQWFKGATLSVVDASAV